MNRSESEIEQLAELRQKLDEVLLRNKALEKRISEKESEAQCAVTRLVLGFYKGRLT